MGTTVAPRGSSIAGEIFAEQPSGLGALGGMLVDLAPMYNSLADLGGVMNAASDTQGNAGAGITDTADPSKAPKKKISSEQVDKIVKRSDEIRGSAMSNEDKKIALSELLTDAGIPHDPNSLDPKFPSDNFGLLSNRIEIVDPVSASAASSAASAGGGSISASDAVQGASGGLESVIADAAAQDEAASLDSTVAADTDLTGSIEKTAAELEAEATAAAESSGGYTAGDVVTDDRIVGDYPFVYDADANVFHYTPFDENGNRIYTGETLDASTVAGFDPSSEDTGATKSIMFDPETGQASIEQVGDASTVTDDTEDTGATGSGLNITITGAGLVDDVINSIIYGPFKTQDEADAAAAANAATTSSTVLTNGDDVNDNGGDAAVTNGDDEATVITNGDDEATLVVDGDGDSTLVSDGDDVTGDDETGNGGDGEIKTNVIPVPNLGGGGITINDPNRNTGTGIPNGRGGGGGSCKMFDAIENTPLTRSILFEPKFTELDNVQLGMFERAIRAAGGIA